MGPGSNESVEPFRRWWHKENVDEEQLVSALRRQEPQALAGIVDAFGERLLRSAYLLCGSEADAQDLVQETFVQALGAVRRFEGRSSVYTWLHGILLNLARHYHRERGRWLCDEERLAERDSTAPADTIAEADFDAASDALQAALSRLSQPLKEVLLLRFYEGMKIEQMSRHLGVPAGTVKSRLHYALKQMQKLVPAEMNLFSSEGTNMTRAR